MHVHTSYFAFARMRGAPDAPRPGRQRRAGRTPIGPNEQQRRHYRELMGVGVLIAALIVVLWPGSLLVLALGALLALLVIFAALLFFVWRRPR